MKPKRKLHLGVGLPGKQVKSLGSVRIDLRSKESVKEYFSLLIDEAYQQLQMEGENEYYDELEKSLRTV